MSPRPPYSTGKQIPAKDSSLPALQANLLEAFAEAYATRDEDKRKALVRELTREIVDKAPHIWLPNPYVFTAWWPWVKNYGGELRAGAVRPGPIYARIWVDQELKKKLGH